VVVLYLNIRSQFKKGDDLVIYEMDYTTNEQLQDICKLCQPFSFEFTAIPEMVISPTANEIDVHIKDMEDYHSNPKEIVICPLSYHKSKQLVSLYPKYISEQNQTFIKESGLPVTLYDSWIKPTHTIRTKYDYMFGGKDGNTILQYHTNNRKFIHVLNGKIRVRMTCWKHTDELQVEKDYELYEFRSLMEIDKVKHIDFELGHGYMLYIPSYWWYIIQYMENGTDVCMITYDSIMSDVVNVPHTVLYYVQQQNIRPKMARKLPETTTTASNEEDKADKADESFLTSSIDGLNVGKGRD
jgi:hypothetical protein